HTRWPRDWSSDVCSSDLKRRVAEVLLDLCLIPIAYYSAYHLRFGEDNVLLLNYQFFLQSLPIVLACQLIALFVMGGYRGTWRFLDRKSTRLNSSHVAISY